MDLFTEVKVDEETVRTGAMIALRPRQDHIDRIAVVDGEAPNELHTTILFLGKGADYSYDTRARIIYAMREVAQNFRQVTGNGFGINIWNPAGEEPCIVLGVGGSELVDIRNAIVEKLQGFDLMQVPEQHEPWQPHITLNYTDDFGKAVEYVDLAGDVVYDAIRVVFSGIVDDIPLQATDSDNDGYAGGNRYAAVPLTVVKSFRPDIRVNRLFFETKRGGIKVPQKCKYCSVQATHYVLHSEGHGYVPYCGGHKDKATRDAEYCTPDGTRDPSNVIRHGELPQKKMLTVRIPASGSLVLDEKVIRRVRTAAGVRRFGQPIGSVIVSDGKLSNLKTVDSEYDGYDKYTRGGKAIYVHKTGGKYEAVDANDRVIATHTNQESLLKELDGGGAKKTSGRIPARTQQPGRTKVQVPPSTTGTSRVPLGYREFVTAEESEYDGYHKYKGKNGKTFYAADDWSALYDENDNELAKGRGDDAAALRRSLFDAMAKESAPSAKKKAGTTPARPVAPSSASSDSGAVQSALQRQRGPIVSLSKADPMVQKAMQDAYEVQLPNGMSSVLDMKQSKVKKSGTISVSGSIMKDGQKVGYFTRSIDLDKNRVHNATIHIDPEHTGQRFGDAFYEKSEKVLESIGVKDIELLANDDVGGYAWARRGFQFDKLEAEANARYMTYAIDKFLKNAKDLAAQDRRKLETWRKAFEKLKSSDNAKVPTPAEIASLGEGRYKWTRTTQSGREYVSWPGKDLLLGSQWLGVRPIRQTQKKDDVSDYMAEIAKHYDEEEMNFKPDSVAPHDGKKSDYNMFHVDLHMGETMERKDIEEAMWNDPFLRAEMLSVKLITPGGRVGSGASLNRSRRRNWVENSPMGRLPKYIRIVANGLKKAGHGISRAIALAVAAMKRWARGGNNVRPQVQAAAAKALAEWEALKASA